MRRQNRQAILQGVITTLPIDATQYFCARGQNKGIIARSANQGQVAHTVDREGVIGIAAHQSLKAGEGQDRVGRVGTHRATHPLARDVQPNQNIAARWIRTPLERVEVIEAARERPQRCVIATRKTICATQPR